VPSPFTDSGPTVKRPALVLSGRSFNAKGHTVLAMIADAGDQPAAGCPDRSPPGRVVALDNCLLLRRIGNLAGSDRKGKYFETPLDNVSITPYDTTQDVIE
jgi:hypothetical protein